MPLYNLQEFQQMVHADRWGYFNIRRPHANLDKLGWSDEYLARVLCGLDEQRDFQKTVPNCAVNDLEGHEFLDADQYKLYWDEVQGVGCIEPDQATVCLSLKIAIIQDEDGSWAGVVTFHT